ncbi:unnamed protein product, partial [Closterium sp. NIES-54]
HARHLLTARAPPLQPAHRPPPLQPARCPLAARPPPLQPARRPLPARLLPLQPARRLPAAISPPLQLTRRTPAARSQPACGSPAALCSPRAPSLFATCAPPLAARSPLLAARLPPPLQPVHCLAAASPVPCAARLLPALLCTDVPCPASFPSARAPPCLRAALLWLLSVSSRSIMRADAMVTTTTPWGQRVSICTCTRTGRHLATFTRRPGSSRYTLASEPPQVAVSAQVSASGPIAPPCSCRLLTHQTLPWHHRLGHPSLPRLHGMHSRLLVSGLPSKGEVPDVLIPWIRAIRLQLRERFGQDLPVLRLHFDRGGEFSSDLLWDFCHGEGILQSFMLPASPQPNGIAEHRIGLVMEVARTSMIHCETSPTLRWTGKVGNASVFHDVTFDELVPFYHLFHYRSAPLPPPPLFLAPGPPPVDPLPPQGPAPSGVSQINPLPSTMPVEVTIDSGAARGAASGGAAFGGAEPAGTERGGAESEGGGSGGAEPGGAEPAGAESEGAEPGGPLGALSRREPLSPPQLREWFATCTRLRSGSGESAARGTGAPGPGGTGAAGAGGTAGFGAGAAGGTGAAGPRGARNGGTGGAGAGGAARVGARGSGTGAAGGTGVGAAGGTGAAGPGGARTRGTGAAGAGGAAGIAAGDPGTGDPEAGGPGAVGAGSGDTGRSQPYFVPLLQHVLGLPSSTGLTPPFLCPPRDHSQPPLQPAYPLRAPSPYTEQTGGLTERREPVSCPASLVHAVPTGCRVPRQRPPLIPGMHHMALYPSSVPQCVPLPSPPASSLADGPDHESDLARAASPNLTRLLATVLIDPSFEFVATSALVAELVDFAAACRLDYAASLVAESESAVLRPSGKSTGTYVDAVPPSGANIVDGMWIFRVKWSSGSPPAFKARYVARGFSQREGVYFFQTFSPTPKMTTLWVLLHIVAQRDYELHSLDLSTAVLQGSLHEEIWLRRPPGFTGSFPAGTQWSLYWPVYGLRQAPRE